jgi:omega-6 fatty acid desaturase (delta-12 desaturase)
VLPYGALWALMLFTVRNGYPYWLTALLMALAGGMLVRVFILFHDCCHGSLFTSRRANRIVGYLTGVLTFTPFDDWKFAHNLHHASAGNLNRRGIGDIKTMTKEEYLAASRRKRLAYRIYRHPLILFGPGAALLFLVFQRFHSKNAGKRERASVVYTNLTLLIIGAVASATIGLQTYLTIQLPVLLIAGSSGLWLFYVQHQFSDVYWARHERWDPLRVALEGSSYLKLPRILQWLTSNIGLHHVHHLKPQIPNYNLQRCHNEIPEFQAVTPITLWTSAKLLGLALYDEAEAKLIGFRALKMRRGESSARVLTAAADPAQSEQ